MLHKRTAQVSPASSIFEQKKHEAWAQPNLKLSFFSENSEKLEALVVKLVNSGQIVPKMQVYIIFFSTYVWVPVGVLSEKIDIDLIWNEKTSSP
jgi:hypothetical protein